MARDDPQGNILGADTRTKIINDAENLPATYRRQCTAHSKQTKQRCRRPPIMGGFVCKHHGGGIPHVAAAARARLRSLVDPAIDVLIKVLNLAYREVCPTCEMPDAKMIAVAVKAAQIVLDRCGYQPKAELTVKLETPESQVASGWERFMPEDRLELMTQWIAEAKEAARVSEPMLELGAGDVAVHECAFADVTPMNADYFERVCVGPDGCGRRQTRASDEEDWRSVAELVEEEEEE